MIEDFRAELPPAWNQSEEFLFRVWFENQAKKNGLDPNPDVGDYNYRAAYRANAASGADSHWPSEYKTTNHPNRFINGYDSINQGVILNDAQMLYRRDGL